MRYLTTALALTALTVVLGVPLDAVAAPRTHHVEGERVVGQARVRGGRVRVQRVIDVRPPASGNAVLRWDGAARGSKLMLPLPVQRIGRFKVHLRIAKGPVHGDVAVRVGVSKTVKRISAYAPRFGLVGAMDLGVHDVTSIDGHGRAWLQLAMTGKDVRSRGMRFDIDGYGIEWVGPLGVSPRPVPVPGGASRGERRPRFPKVPTPRPNPNREPARPDSTRPDISRPDVPTNIAPRQPGYFNLLRLERRRGMELFVEHERLDNASSYDRQYRIRADARDRGTAHFFMERVPPGTAEVSWELTQIVPPTPTMRQEAPPGLLMSGRAKVSPGHIQNTARFSLDMNELAGASVALAMRTPIPTQHLVRGKANAATLLAKQSALENATRRAVRSRRSPTTHIAQRTVPLTSVLTGHRTLYLRVTPISSTNVRLAPASNHVTISTVPPPEELVDLSMTVGDPIHAPMTAQILSFVPIRWEAGDARYRWLVTRDVSTFDMHGNERVLWHKGSKGRRSTQGR